MTTIGSSKEQLGVGWKVLSNKWESTKSVWHDSQSAAFEQQFWVVLERYTQGTLVEMEKLAQAITNAHNRVHEVRRSY